MLLEQKTQPKIPIWSSKQCSKILNQDLGLSTLDEVCGEGTILASNTSSLSVNALAEATGRPDRFVGLHFFYHPAKNRLIEVIPAETTSKDTLIEPFSTSNAWKVVIVCKDRPGFVVNRFFVPG